MDIDKWAKSPLVSDQKYWEGLFPGYGARIVELTKPFQGWAPVLGLDAGHFNKENVRGDMLEATRWVLADGIEIFDAHDGNIAQKRLTCDIGSASSHALNTLIVVDNGICRRVHGAVRNAFGSVGAQPAFLLHMLRCRLYQLLVDAICSLLVGDEDALRQFKTILEYWGQGCYLIGFQFVEGGPRTAIVIVAEE